MAELLSIFLAHKISHFINEKCIDNVSKKRSKALEEI